MDLQVIGKQKIGNYEFVGIEGGFGRGKKALRVMDIANIHKTDSRTINQTINRNLSRFKEGIDILDLKLVVTQSDIESFGFNVNQWNPSKNIYILSERGYSKLLKILEDDTAWEIYDELVDGYFKMRDSQPKLPTDPMEILRLTFEAQEQTNERVDAIESDIADIKDNQLITTEDKTSIDRMVRQKVSSICKDQRLNKEAKKLLFADLGSSIKRLFNVPHRGRIKAKNFFEVVEFINTWEPDSVTKATIRQSNLFDD